MALGFTLTLLKFTFWHAFAKSDILIIVAFATHISCCSDPLRPLHTRKDDATVKLEYNPLHSCVNALLRNTDTSHMFCFIARNSLSINLMSNIFFPRRFSFNQLNVMFFSTFRLEPLAFIRGSSRNIVKKHDIKLIDRESLAI